MACLFAQRLVIPIGTENPSKTIKSRLNEDRVSGTIGCNDFGSPTLFDRNFVSQTLKEAQAEIQDGRGSKAAASRLKDVLRQNAPWTAHLSSGTTGSPKCVVHRISNYMKNVEALNAHLNLKGERRHLHIFPVQHMAGFLNTFCWPFMRGDAIIIANELRGANVSRFWQVVRDKHIDVVWLTPQHAIDIERLDRRTEGSAPRNLLVMVGTSPLLPATRNRWKDRYGLDLCASYGLSELLILSAQRQGKRTRVPDGNGPLLPSVEVRIENQAEDLGKHHSSRQSGKIFVKVPWAGDYRAPVKGGLEMRKHWWDTGDLGGLVNNELTTLGRETNVIIRGGIKMYPESIEESLLQVWPDAYIVVTKALSHHEERAVLLVDKESLKHPSIAPLNKAIVNERLSQNFGSLVKIDFFLIVDEIPLTESGKIHRRACVEIATRLLANDHRG